MEATSTPVLPGETLAGKYKVERILGQGGMGVVVAARHLELDERVAIKFLIGAPGSAAIERFLREARAAAKVKSEHVCHVHDVGRLASGEPYIVMEYLEGVDLGCKVETEGPQPIDLVTGWVIEACDALAEAHALGIVHRDLKPANLFLTRRSNGSTTTKVLDFGISKLPAERGSDPAIGSMTQSATMLGSPLYMSPEQIESSRSVDARSDIWSLGVVLYELASGGYPWEAESMVQLAFKLRDEPAQPLSKILPGIAPAFERVVMKCLAKRASDRYASVTELAADLAPFASPDAAALAARLGRPAGRSSEPSLPFHPTMRDTPSARELDAAKPPRVTPAATLGETIEPRGAQQLTFAPLHTTMDKPSPRMRRRGATVAILGVAFAAVLAIGGISRWHAPAPAALVTPASVPVATPEAASIANVIAAATSETAPSVAPSASATPTPTPAKVRPRTTPRVAAPEPSSPRVEPSITPPPVETAPPAPPSTGKKRRSLDRSDP